MRVFVSRRLPQIGMDMLRRAQGLQVDIWDDEAPPSRATLLSRVAGCSGILTMLTDKVDVELLDCAGAQLRVVSQCAVGIENIDGQTCAARGIAVRNTPGVLTNATADVAMALLLACARRLPEGQARVKNGEWGVWAPTTFLGKDLDNAVLGIVGFGRIGQAVAKRAESFGMRVIFASRSNRPGSVQLEELFKQADYISLNCDLNATTRHIINARTLSLMKDSATIINTARGGCVDQDALFEALRTRPTLSAGLDVTDPEPLSPSHPLLTLPNCLIVPHVGSATHATRDKMAVMAVTNLLHEIGVAVPQ